MKMPSKSLPSIIADNDYIKDNNKKNLQVSNIDARLRLAIEASFKRQLEQLRKFDNRLVVQKSHKFELLRKFFQRFSNEVKFSKIVAKVRSK